MKTEDRNVAKHALNRKKIHNTIVIVFFFFFFQAMTLTIKLVDANPTTRSPSDAPLRGP